MMEMPMLFQEKMLAGLDLQIRTAVAANGFWIDDPSLIRACIGPWDLPVLFTLPTGDPTPVIDQYELRAVCHGQIHAIETPDHDEWARDIEDPMSVPLFSPFDVWTAVRRHMNGDPGIQERPITCDTDKLLRNIRRGYANVHRRVDAVANNAHDLDLLETALEDGDLQGVVYTLDRLIAEHSVWKTRTFLEADAAAEYSERYSKTSLSRLRGIMEVRNPSYANCVATWISPSIIPLIEQAEVFQEATRQPRWLLYRAVTIQKSRLHEEQHNRMLAEAMNENPYAKAYLDFVEKKWPS